MGKIVDREKAISFLIDENAQAILKAKISKVAIEFGIDFATEEFISWLKSDIEEQLKK